MNSKGTSVQTLRERYVLEAERIKEEIGDLEQIRLSLGLSQRKLCQLLMVDPSAWTRWLKAGAPPHVFQSLKWLMELRKVNPEAAGPSNISNRVDLIQSTTHSKLKEIENNVAQLERIIISSAISQKRRKPRRSLPKKKKRPLKKIQKNKKKKIKVKRKTKRRKKKR